MLFKHLYQIFPPSFTYEYPLSFKALTFTKKMFYCFTANIRKKKFPDFSKCGPKLYFFNN